MHVPKYSQTAVELLRRIRSGVYANRLPPMRELAGEFNIAIQTMFNAVQLLVQKEVLKPCGSGGMLIDRSKLPCGVVAIVIYDTMLPYSSTFAGLIERITDDGFTPVFLGLPKKQPAFMAQRLFQADLSGVIFLYSTINPEFGEVLNSLSIPFVSANISSGVKKVNFIETDAFAVMDFLVKELYEKGYRNIAINLISPLEGYLRYSIGQWRKILKKYGLPYSPYNSFRDEFPMMGEDENYETIAPDDISGRGELPEVVINWSGSGIRVVKTYAGKDVLLVFNKDSIKCEYLPEDAVVFSAVPDSTEQRRELWNLLLSMLIGGGGKTVHHFLDNIKFCLHNKIPDITEYQRGEK